MARPIAACTEHAQGQAEHRRALAAPARTHVLLCEFPQSEVFHRTWTSRAIPAPRSVPVAQHDAAPLQVQVQRHGGAEHVDTSVLQDASAPVLPQADAVGQRGVVPCAQAHAVGAGCERL